jgi:hypothetical protein
MKTFSIKKEIAIHILFWVIYFIGYFITLSSENSTLFTINNLDVFNITFLFTTTSAFYLNYIYILKNSFKSHNLGTILFGFIIAFSYFIAVRYLMEEVVVFYVFGYRNYFEDTTVAYYVLDNMHWASTPILASSILWIVINFIRALQKQVLITEEKKRAEIQFLKSQINPHFIFNTLNNIYSLVVSKSENALNAIEKLSEIMRFTTYETQKEQININDEVTYMRSLIDLEGIRMSKPIQIQLEVTIENKNLEIPPYLMLPFVENGIKHAVIDDPKNPALVAITCTKNSLTIVAENKINHKLKDEHSGIGFENLQKRLNYYFPERHNWNIHEDETFFKSILTIQL